MASHEPVVPLVDPVPLVFEMPQRAGVRVEGKFLARWGKVAVVAGAIGNPHFVKDRLSTESGPALGIAAQEGLHGHAAAVLFGNADAGGRAL